MNKILQYVGLAQRAGACCGGGMQTESTIRQGKAKLLILADDASENTRKKLENLAKRYHVPVIYTADRDALGHAAGKDLRSACVITDRGFADAILRVTDK